MWDFLNRVADNQRIVDFLKLVILLNGLFLANVWATIILLIIIRSGQ